jgi:outer membrane protein OmpA-like peptidoglycan-associated protein
MSSPLSFSATEQYRKALLVKNLKPYNDDGFVPTSEPGQTEFNINDQSVIDSVEVEVIGETQSEKLFIKNIYGPDGGYGFPIEIEDVFSPSLSGGVGKEPYYTFVASTYNAFSILTSNNPQGSNGSLSQDSALARIAAESLQTEFEYRIAQETYQQTLGRINAIDAVSDPYELLSIVTGNRTVIERDWKISVPKGLIGKGLDFISRISGVYSPYSWIPGDYFSASPRKLFLNQAANAVTGLFDKRGTLRLPTEKTGMRTFLENTGGGQRSRLFKGLSMNRYIPDYNRNLFSDNFTTVPKQNYYIGSSKQEISDIVAPQNELPIDQDGNKVQTAVRGYSEVSKLYEGNKNFKFGLNSYSYTDDSIGIMGGFTWVSPKFKDSAGSLVGKGGDKIGQTDVDFGQINTVFESSQSTNYEFTKGSILDDTQKLIEAADLLNGEAKLQHVGNAIDQVSKVFNDGYKELTKGSRVINYVNNASGQIEGREYCRVFTKDRPYLFMNELQKSAGMTTENRRFTYSVLDKTYNLNIAPTRGEDSTNIIDGSVKKYMFSIENLAWRTSTKPGFTYQDLPHCEKGPNGGRIMWFPPYDMNVSETNSANWTSNEFLGRPEPIYTYNNTTRQGSLSWKIVVDHPSILNAIVDKELKGENNERVNAIVDSFFAGCRKYDIYELARRFPQFTFQDIYDIITTNPDPEVVRETYEEEVPDQPTDETPPAEVVEKIFNSPNDGYDFEFYFDHDVPGPKDKKVTETTEEYFTTLTNYISRKNQYINFNPTTTNFFDSKIEIISGRTTELVTKISKALNEDHTLTITLIGSASAPGDPTYNEALSKRRIDSVKKYLFNQEDENKIKLETWFNTGRLVIKEDAKGEGETIETGNGLINCADDLVVPNNIYSINAMYCRRVRILTITDVPPTPEEKPQTDEAVVEITSGETNETEPPTNPIPQRPTTTAVRREQIAKIIVKKLLTECDYFDLLKEDSPIAYNGIKEKLKYFQPAFHAITPEGLNSRLTFLQQCIRPGDTIPVIGPDGRPTENDARNTAFGAPPICILRIGDFYHTKIAINQLTIQYEPLIFDLNPEGIGVQPMIATINMSFYFIGGQGLKEPVNRLQNALSFNYYANTEVYDDRSIKTDPSLDELNAEIWEDIQLSLDENGKPTIDVVPDSGDAIGTFIGQETFSNYSGGTASTINGQISYKDKSLLLIDNSKKYVDSVVNSFTDITEEYSFDLLYYFDKRPYSNGRVLGYYVDGGLFTGNSKNLDIYGSPLSIQDKIDFLFNQALLDIDNETSPILKDIQNKSFKNRDIRKLKNNIKAYITSKKSNYTNNMLSAIKNITINELNLIRDIDELNFVLTNTDGYRLNNNKTILLDLTATTNVTNTGYTNTYEELENDISTIGTDLQDFNNAIFDDNDRLFKSQEYNTGYTFTLLDSPNNTPADVRFMHIFFNEVLNDNDNLIKNLMGEDLYNNNENIRKYIEEIVKGVIDNSIIFENSLILGNEQYGNNNIYIPSTVTPKDGLFQIYRRVFLKGNNLFSEFNKKSSVTKFVDYSPYNNKDKERLFNYSKISASQVVNYPDKLNMFNRLRSGLNQQSSPTERNYRQIKFNGTVNFK